MVMGEGAGSKLNYGLQLISVPVKVELNDNSLRELRELQRKTRRTARSRTNDQRQDVEVVTTQVKHQWPASQ